MPLKQLVFAPRAERELIRIEDWYRSEGGDSLAAQATEAILDAAERLATLPVVFRPAARAGLREYVLERFPFILLHRVSAHKIEIVAIIHQRKKR